ncbi:MAG: FixH family protein [Hyphomicrobiaceae bacterium]|nr:MAG: FixH family protein [Hyphomicrobiaceae bacterium]
MPAASKGIQGRHVLLAMVVFFGIVFAVNGIFLYSALSTYTGVVAQEPYRKGLQYNQRIGEGAKQDALGWREDVRVDRQGVTLRLVDRDGQPVTGLKVAGFIGRPSTNQQDIRVALREANAGIYSVQLETLQAGSWIVNLEASPFVADKDEVTYRTRKRIWLKP